MISTEFLSHINLFKAYAYGIYKLAEIVIIDKYEDLIFVVF